ncbi:hypothetical protein [Micromonospora avicenniae]|uniref:hypothetical protein n=1 Tax=Micromonospora avicenniae TaxID=1198245 RepID=UPI00331EEA62
MLADRDLQRDRAGTPPSAPPLVVSGDLLLGEVGPRPAAGQPSHRSPAGTDPEKIARYVMTIANGVAVRAASGATCEDLQQVADAALRNRPPA